MIRRWLAALVLGLCAAHAAVADRIERIEPQSWWVGMKHEQLQLMVHGDRVAGLVPTLQYAGVTIEGIERVANPNYLFVNLRITADAKPGEFAIDFREGRRTIASRSYVLHAREAGSAERAGFGPQDVIYLVMPDRFANGDPSNDTVKGLRDGLDRTEPYGRHGGDLQGIVDHLDYVAGMGFTQLWLNPVLENAQPSITYHGYAITDFYKVDPRLGTNEGFRQLAAEARKRGIGLIKDVVLNHCGSEHWWMKDPPTPDWVNMGGKFVATHHVREALQDPHAAEVDRRDFTDGWFVETMPDLNQRNPYLANYLIQHTLWWIEYAGLSGLRIDTYPYSDRGFLAEWSRRVTEEYPNLNVVGEEWSGSPVTVSYWQRGRKPADGYVSYLPGLFDFPLHEAVLQGLQEKEDWGTGLRRIYRVLAADALYPDPYNLVVFPDNHDVNRMFTVLGERADLQRMAVAFFLTTRGIPQLFYGTEILMASPGPKNDGVIRSDFPGGWAGDRRNAFTGEGLTEAERGMQDYTRALLQWRRTATALHDGKLTHFVPLDGIYVYFRHNAAQTVMVVMNNNDEARSVETQRFREVIGTASRGVDVVTKQVHDVTQHIEAPGRSVTILELDRPEPVPVTGPGVTGALVRHASMPSAHVAARNVDIWLPPSYGQDPGRRYPVLYMHDGQNLFDPATSYGNVDWAVDEAMTRLIEQGEVREAIVVGVWNTPKRFQEYMPQRAVQGVKKIKMPGFDVRADEVISDRYLAFLVTELKPFIDANYRTLPDRANTTIMGSSMGGLISQYAMSRYPDVFGGAGCVSTHWPAGDGIALADFAAHLPDPATHRYWFDFGTATLDASYEPYQQRADDILRKAGYVEGENWVTKKFEGAEHSEKAWRLRVDQPLRFLIGR